MYSDNGLNFVRANKELSEAFQLIVSELTQLKLHHICSRHRTTWHFAPKRAPHFGGMWESGVKLVKKLLRKNIGPCVLTFEQLSTILSEAEATLNSCPLLAMDSTSPDGVTALTPGHFLVGRPLLAPPLKVDHPSFSITATLLMDFGSSFDFKALDAVAQGVFAISPSTSPMETGFAQL